MKIVSILMSAVFAVLALAGIVWLSKGGTLSTAQARQGPASQEPESTEPRPEDAPQISPTGPYPTVVVDEPVFRFEAMLSGEEMKHTFVIRNEGKALLILKEGKTTCKCTVSKLANSGVLPGESVEVELSWKPRALTQQFRQTAMIHTNDPKKPDFDLAIEGTVEPLVVLVPKEGWEADVIADDKTTELTGYVFSRMLEEFQILKVTSPADFLTAKVNPMSKEDREKVNAKSGYVISAKLQPGMSAGYFREQLNIETDIQDNTVLTLYVRGKLAGPYQFQPLSGIQHWYPATHSINLGRFESNQGKKATMLLLVKDMDGREFEFVNVDSGSDFLKVTLERRPNGKSASHGRFHVTFEVPPGSPPATRVNSEFVTVNVTTNHPKEKTLTFRVQYMGL